MIQPRHHSRKRPWQVRPRSGLLMAAALLNGCQPSDAGEAPAPTPAATTTAAPASTIAAISGVWEPYSRGADLEFGSLEITQERLTLARFGSADYQLRGRYAVLTWHELRPDADELCGNAPPALVEFRLQDKSEILAPRTPGEWLEVSFYASAEAISKDRATSAQLCRSSTWSR